MIVFHIDANSAAAGINYAQATTTDLKAGAKVAGRTLANMLRAHYRRKQQAEPNRLGGRRTNFWADIARGINNPESTGENQVSVGFGDVRLLHKIFGGTITAKRAGALTIPMHPNAHGRSVAQLKEDNGLVIFRVLDTLWGYKRGGGESVLYYLLRKSVTQKPWPGSIPTKGEMEAVVSSSFTEWLRSKLN